MEKKKYESMTPLERAEYAKWLAEKSEKIANISVGFSAVAIILLLIGSLDKIKPFVYWLQSYLN